ncbi:DgyrCDS6141 [Dimorphilus gyrociliatus]|uniref:DgyrCDS6141 n=1 Tax=Dimorphilus gyrociliatus TaxID=2664684 RepID=A0A7I8VNT2_9ANNE|nr:DgyrCDS6141 [Dimorphilus gyrociliatus]
MNTKDGSKKVPAESGATSSTQKVSLRGTENYIFYSNDKLGAGATATVFLGRHKKTGEKYALKVFFQKADARPLIIKLREFELLQTVKHENIVQFFGQEKETVTQDDIAILEYCSGSNLHSLIEQPENLCGLSEKRVLLVLKHLKDAVEYLFSNNIVHRDIKPGNILRTFTEDGREIFKLADFGAAKILSEQDEGFKSLYGTEEFLHPEIFKEALAPRQYRGSERHFKYNTDLWSIGCTIYHIATGRLPFKAHEGRKDRESLYKIITKKPDDALSAVQDPVNKKISYFTELPNDIRLSKGGKREITKILRGLLSVRRPWECGDYFRAVKDLVEKKIVYVFLFESCSICHIFVEESNFTIENLKKKIYEDNEDVLHDKRLIFNGESITHLTSIPATTKDKPIMVIPKNFIESEMQNFKLDIVLPLFQPGINCEDDLNVSKRICGMLHFFLRRSKELHHCMNILADCCSHLTAMSRKYVTTIQGKVEHLSINEQLLNYIRVSPGLRRSIQNKIDSIKDINLKLSRDIDKKPYLSSRCQDTDSCKEKISVHVFHGEKSLFIFKANKTKGKLTYNEEQIHKFERNKLAEYCALSYSILMDVCYKSWKSLSEKNHKWYRDIYRKVIYQTCEIENLIKETQELMTTVIRENQTPAENIEFDTDNKSSNSPETELVNSRKFKVVEQFTTEKIESNSLISNFEDAMKDLEVSTDYLARMVAGTTRACLHLKLLGFRRNKK